MQPVRNATELAHLWPRKRSMQKSASLALLSFFIGGQLQAGPRDKDGRNEPEIQLVISPPFVCNAMHSAHIDFHRFRRQIASKRPCMVESRPAFRHHGGRVLLGSCLLRVLILVVPDGESRVGCPLLLCLVDGWHCSRVLLRWLVREGLSAGRRARKLRSFVPHLQI